MIQELTQKWNPELYNSKHAFVFGYGHSLIDVLQPEKQERILDLGCGSGALTNQIALKANYVVGIDKSAEMIENARMHYPEVVFEIGDAADCRFENPFDAIFSNATLHWVLRSDQAIANMYANLKKGGRIVLEFGGKDNVKTIVEALRAVLKKRGLEAQASTEPWFFPSIGEYTSALENHGFRVTFAQWFDRPTQLADTESGVVDWLMMFAGLFFKGIDEREVQHIVEEVQHYVRPELYKSGKWYADYKRIRIQAYKD